MAHRCEQLTPRLMDLVGPTSHAVSAALREEVESCPRCRAELRILEEEWAALPGPESLARSSVAPSDVVRRRILNRAVESLRGAPERERGRAVPQLARLLLTAAAPVLIGTTAAGALLLLAGWRGALAPVSSAALVGLSLGLAALLTAVAQGLLRERASLAVRAVLRGAAGAFAGYALLSLAFPIPATVDVCGELVFGGVRLSLGRLCLIYLAVTAWYAGIPMAVAAYASAGGSVRGTWLHLEALIFAVMAVPVVLLQSGFDVWLVPATGVAGFAIGALIGASLGQWTRRRRLAPTLSG